MPADPKLPPGELASVFGAGTDPSRVSAVQVYEPVASASTGIWRVRAGDDSAILKVIAHSDAGHRNWRSGTDPGHWYYWRREALAYETGLLESLPGGLRAPTHRLVANRDDGSVALWLEDLRSTPASSWSLERYGVAARHLGQMQGAFLAGRPIPDHEWLSRGWLRSYLLQRDGDMHLVEQTALWEDSRLAQWFPHPPIERVRAMRDGQSVFVDALDALPRTLCHLDLHPANIFGDAHENVTTVIDWSFVGIGAIGEDAGNLVPDAVLDFHFDPARLDDLHATVANGYTAGLHDAGAHDIDAAARLGMAATIAAKYAWIAPAILGAIAEDRPDLNRRPIAESLRWWGPAVGFLLDRADEARSLLR